MDCPPLSSSEVQIISGIADAIREAEERLGRVGDLPPERRWWEGDSIAVTELASDWGGIGRDETLATFTSPTAFLYANLSTAPSSRASSLVLVDSYRGPLAVRFRPYRKKGSTLRFLVGQPGRRASVWRLWTGTTDDDIYLGDRHSTRYAKYSLHASGDWRLQWNTDDRTETRYWSERGIEPDGRVMARWAAPAVGPAGWTHAMSIFTTADDVVDVPTDDRTHGGPVLVPTPEPGWVVEFAVFLITPDSGLWDMSRHVTPPGASARLVGGYLLPGGRTVMVWAFTCPLPPGISEMLREEREKSAAHLRRAGWSLHPSWAPRSHAICMPDSRPIEVWDLALAGTSQSRRTDLML